MAPGYALGRGAPALVLLHTTPGLGQRGRRARHGARQPRAAGGARRPAGPPPPRARAVPHRPAGGARGRLPGVLRAAARAQDVPGAVVRAYHAAASARGPAIVVVPQDDWASRASCRELGPRRGGALGRRPTRRPSTSWRAARGGELARPGGGRGRRRAERWAALVRWPSASTRPCGRSPSARGRASRRTTGCSRATCPPAAPGCARRSPTTWCSRSARRVFRQYPYARARCCATGTRPRSHRRPRRGAPQPGRVRGDRRPAERLRGARRRGRAAGADPARPRGGPRDAARRPAPAAAARRPRARGAGRAAPARGGGGRGDAVEPPRAARAPPRAPRRSGFVSARWALLGFGAPGARPACGWRAPSARWWRWSATAPRCSGSRRCGARRATAPASCSSCSPTTATRSWTGSPSATAARGPWPAFGAIDIAAMARAQGCDARRIEHHDELLAALDEVVPDARPPRDAAAARGGRGGRHDVQPARPAAVRPVFIASSTACSGARRRRARPTPRPGGGRRRGRTARRARRCRSSRSAPAPRRRGRADQRVHLRLGADVDAARRVVEQHHRRLRVEPLGEHDLLLVAARQRARRVVDRRACGRAARAPARARARAARPARTISPSAASPTARTWPMFSQIGLSSISPSRRRSPGTSATPARIALRSPCGTGRPPGSVTVPRVGRAGARRSAPAPRGGRRPPRPRARPPRRASTRRVSGSSAPSTAASRSSSAGAAASTSSASATCSRSRRRRPPPRASSTGWPSIALTITGTVSSSRGSALIATCAVAQHGDLVAQRHHVLEDVRDEHDPDVAVAQHPQRVEQHLRARAPSADVGSSRIRTRGSVSSALAISSSWRWARLRSSTGVPQRHVETELAQHGPRLGRHLARARRTARA